MSLAEPARGRQPGSPPHPLPVVHRLRAAREGDSTAPHASAAGNAGSAASTGIDQAVPGEVVPVARETAAARPDPAAGKADSQPDLEQLTEQVWRSILDRLLIEQERRGGSTWLA